MSFCPFAHFGFPQVHETLISGDWMERGRVCKREELDASNSNRSAKVPSRVTALYLLALAGLLLWMLLFRLLPFVPDAHPTHASEVFPGISPLTAADIQRLEGTLHGTSASVRFALIMAAQFVLWGLMLRSARRMPDKAAAQAGLI